MPTQKPSRAAASKSKQPPAQSSFSKAMQEMQQQPATAFPNISARWLLSAAGVVVLLALACAWLTLCLLFWQGSWQLLYHPKAAITRTPASVGLSYETIHFATTETGTPQLTGWWLPAADSGKTITGKTVLLLHGADGNLGDTVDTLAALHRQNLSVFAFDYRSFGQSLPARPSEEHLRQDAESALSYLTQTRHIELNSIVLYGTGLGANLAAELAASHNALAGAILAQPQADPVASIFSDSRSKLVPAHWIVSDRYDLTQASQSLKVPSLWLIAQPTDGRPPVIPQAYETVASHKTAATLRVPFETDPNYTLELKRWLDDL
ncbi:alpha/beta hydrolase [Acidicapsa ligni]|uniref:alpha/beta hydrolase n=1 Tax=Acidicapsa ligni TaxID=542300 RepID=UPI0021DFC5D0|nr:lysophospholipase [Acidicapsa ligni]